MLRGPLGGGFDYTLTADIADQRLPGGRFEPDFLEDGLPSEAVDHFLFDRAVSKGAGRLQQIAVVFIVRVVFHAAQTDREPFPSLRACLRIGSLAYHSDQGEGS
jgi:hypothetical protein